MKRSVLRMSIAIVLVGAALGVGTYWNIQADGDDAQPAVPGSVNDPSRHEELY